MAKTPENTANVTGNVMMYENPQPLTKDKHAKFGVKSVEKPFTFMEKSHFMPLTAVEFGAACSSFPIIFAGDDKTPLAVMGIRGEENLFVKDGIFDNSYYMPSFARRYPFVLAGDTANDRFVVCVDESAECVTNKKPDQAFFEGDEPSKFTNEAFEFLKAFEQDRRTTEAMITRFKELDLFEQKEMNFQGNNADGSLSEKQKIADYFAVTDEKLRGLDEKTLKEFMDNGYLSVAYAHMVSLGNWQRLVNMTLLRSQNETKKA
ncbi:MAG: SapC family protein [Robiginitomaculum sp.]|nr:SapC family protein [Robiginitomaculum sp.]